MVVSPVGASAGARVRAVLAVRDHGRVAGIERAKERVEQGLGEGEIEHASQSGHGERASKGHGELTVAEPVRSDGVLRDGNRAATEAEDETPGEHEKVSRIRVQRGHGDGQAEESAAEETEGEEEEDGDFQPNAVDEDARDFVGETEDGHGGRKRWIDSQIERQRES